MVHSLEGPFNTGWHSPGGGNSFASNVHDTYPFIDPKQFDLVGKSVLITGASKGVGLATAAAFATAGVTKFALAARSSLDAVTDAVKKAAAAAGKPEPKILQLKVDVTSEESVKAALEEYKKKFGDSLDVLIPNAGYLEEWTPIASSDPSEWRQTWDVNLHGLYLTCRYFLPLVLKSDLKKIITISSIGAQLLNDGASAYMTTKFAVCRLTEFLYAENYKQGVEAFAIHPGGVKTELAHKMPEAMHQLLIDEPALPADSIVWLCAEKRDWLAGRYVDVTWNLEELEKKRAEIVDKDKLKFRLVI